MASKLDKYLVELFDRLNRRGESYRTVCSWLNELGVEMTRQGLRQWHIRKQKRIAQRNKDSVVLQILFPSKSSNLEKHAQCQKSSDVDKITEDLVPPTANGSVQAEKPLDALRDQIMEETIKLGQATGDLPSTFLVKKSKQ